MKGSKFWLVVRKIKITITLLWDNSSDNPSACIYKYGRLIANKIMGLFQLVEFKYIKKDSLKIF
jgi:hypothetical protein